jgi:hypothetical protein
LLRSDKLELVEGEQNRIADADLADDRLHLYLVITTSSVIFGNVQPSKIKDTGDRVQEI